MSNLIDRDALLEAISEAFFKTNPMGEEQLGFLTCSRIAREFPSTAAAEVVRCGECQHRRKPLYPHPSLVWCPLIEHHRRPDWFCADGRRERE